MLVSVKGVGDIEKFFESEQYKQLISENVKIFAVASDERIGNNINGHKISRKDFLKRLKEDGKDITQKIIILHYDILAEGIDVPGITGIMPLRILGKAKFLQTFGRAARMHIEDRKRIENGEISPSDLEKMYKPYAWIIIPSIIDEDLDTKEYIAELIEELRDYSFDPFESIISSDIKHGMRTIETPDALNLIVLRFPYIGKLIEELQAQYEEKYIASLLPQDRIRYILLKENPELADIIK
jgi:hypothetical protein